MSTTAASNNKTTAKYKIHWHVLFTHFPISFFMVSAGFMVLHLFTNVDCFELSGFLTLAAGALMMLPTTISGWLTWKSKYKGATTKIFLYKIRISFGMIALSLLLVAFRWVFSATVHTVWHFIYGVGFVLLFAGALLEGYYGGKLRHG